MSHLVPIDEVVHFDVCTHVASTGAVSDADSAPTFSVYEEDTDTAILGPTSMTKRTSLTGNYRGSVTASAANGFEAGKWYSVIVSATVSTVAAKTVAMHFRCAPAESSAGVPKGDVSHFGGTAGTFASGRPEVNATHAAGTAWGSGAITAASIAADAITAAALASDAGTELATAVWASGTRTLTAIDEDSTTLDFDATIRAAVGMASANLDTQLGDIATDAAAADVRGERTVCRGTVTTGASTTSIPTSALTPAGAAADQFKGRIIIFDIDTTTAALRGQATEITASSNSSTPTFTVTALTSTPASGDTFTIV